MFDILTRLQKRDRQFLLRCVFDEDLVMISIHEVNLVGCHVELTEQDFILGLHSFTFLFLDNIADFAKFRLARGPNLQETLLADLFTKSAWPVVALVLSFCLHRHSVKPCHELDGDVGIEFLRRLRGVLLPWCDIQLRLNDHTHANLVILSAVWVMSQHILHRHVCHANVTRAYSRLVDD